MADAQRFPEIQSFRIQRYPRGLLPALSLKGPGDTPHVLAAETRAIFDTTQLYLQELNTQASFFFNPYANGFNQNAAFVVPASEMWIVTGAGGETSAAAASSGRLQVVYARRSSAYKFWPLQEPQVFAASQTAVIGRALRWQELILQPGDALGVYANGITGTVNGYFNIDYYRLTI